MKHVNSYGLAHKVSMPSTRRMTRNWLQIFDQTLRFQVSVGISFDTKNSHCIEVKAA